MSVNVNTNTNTVTVQDASQTITIIDNGKSNTISIPQPLINVIEVATPGPAGPAGANGANGASINTSSLVTTSSFNVFTSSINAFTASYNTGSFSGSFTGSLKGTASTASYYQEMDPIFVAKSASFATTGSNTFVGNQIISGNLIPAGPYTNNTSSYNLGSPTQAWKDLYVSNGSVTFINGATSASIKLSGSNVVFDGASVILPTSSIVTAAATASYVNALNQNLIVSGNFIVHNTSTNLDSINSDSYYLYDNSGTGSIDWDSKVLYANNGASQLNWSDPDYIQLLNIKTGSASNVAIIDGSGRLFYTASNALSVKTAQTASYLNTLNQNLTLSGSLNVSAGITGSLFGTSSWATNFVSASNYVLNSATSSFVVNSQTSSFVTNSQTSSFVQNSQTSSFVTNSQTSSFVTNSQTSSFVTNSQTSSMSVATASFAQNVYAPSFITYTGGNQANGSVTLTNVATSSATMSIATIGFYEFEIYTTYSSSATSVGIKYSLSGSNSFSYLAAQVNYSISGSDRATFMFNSWDGGGTASSSNAIAGNTAYIYGHVNATSTGPIFLRQASEIGGQTVTTTNVTGYLRRLY